MGFLGSLRGKKDDGEAKSGAAGGAKSGAADGGAVSQASGSVPASDPRFDHVTVVFSPHQDDELLTFGVYASQAIGSKTEREQVFVVLCSDGSKSGIRKKLGNGKQCAKCGSEHVYDLSVPEFSEARDTEFLGSCHAIGYSKACVAFHPDRAVDGSVTVEKGEQVVSSFLSLVDPRTKVTVCALSPFVGPAQHSDHRALGQAAVNLYREGAFDELLLFV